MTDLSAWPALVLTAGLGTRLRPLSLVRAKAALPIAGDVLARRVLRWLRDAGVRRIVLNLHHLPETITPHIGDGRDLGVEVRYSWEPVVLGSAGGPRRALPLLEAERFLIVNGDTLTDASLTALVEQHISSGARVTMTVAPGDLKYGGVIADGQDIVHGFAAPGSDTVNVSPTPSADSSTASAVSPPIAFSSKGSDPLGRFHFVGIQAVEAKVFDDVRDGEASETVKVVYPRLIAKAPGAIRVYRTSAEFHDIGTPADYLATTLRFARDERDLASSNERQSYGGPRLPPPPQLGRATYVHPTARITGSVLWDRVTVGAHADIIDCVVADDVTIPAGARYHRKAIVVVDGKTIVAPLQIVK